MNLCYRLPVLKIIYLGNPHVLFLQVVKTRKFHGDRSLLASHAKAADLMLAAVGEVAQGQPIQACDKEHISPRLLEVFVSKLVGSVHELLEFNVLLSITWALLRYPGCYTTMNNEVHLSSI